MLLRNPANGPYVWAVDGNHPWYDALTWMDQFEACSKKVYSVSGLGRACVSAQAEKGTAIQLLAIFGHGMSGYQSIGAAKDYEGSGNRSLRFAPIHGEGLSDLCGYAENDLRVLNGVLAPNAEIFLSGCGAGEGDNGTGLLTAVSKILQGRTVSAFENSVYWWMPVMIGTRKTVSQGNVSSSPSVVTYENTADQI